MDELDCRARGTVRRSVGKVYCVYKAGSGRDVSWVKKSKARTATSQAKLVFSKIFETTAARVDIKISFQIAPCYSAASLYRCRHRGLSCFDIYLDNDSCRLNQVAGCYGGW